MAYKDVTPPAGGKISIQNGKLNVPDNPILPFIRGDGTGPDIWAASVRVFDAAVQKAYGGKRKIAWFEVFAGEESSKNKFNNWLPDDTVEAFKEYLVGIKGPLTTPVGGGIRSLNVALRQMLDLYVCLRPVQYFQGVPSPVKHPEKVNMVIFRENTEDIYAGIDYAGRHARGAEDSGFHREGIPEGLQENPLRHQAAAEEFWKRSARRIFRPTCRSASASSPSAISGTDAPGSRRHPIRHHAQAQERHDCPQGQHHEIHRRRVPRLGLRAGQGAFGAVEMDGGPWCKIPEGKPGAGIVIKDAIADITLQQVLTRPTDFDVIATLNLNGDYLSDALAAQVGGIGIAPGGNINYVTGHAIFEATHGTAPKYANKDMVNPGSRGAERRNDVPLPGLDRSRRLDSQGPERRDRQQARHLRFRAPDGRRHGNQVLAVRRQHHRAHVIFE